MSLDQYIPQSVSAKTPEELSRRLLAIQVQQGGKVGILSIYWDGTNHVCWFYPINR